MASKRKPSKPEAAEPAPAAGPRVERALVRLADLKPAPYNPRVISKEALAGLGASLDRFGLVQPLVVNRRNQRIIGGHQRAEALRARGIESVEAVLVDLGPADEKALNLALNSAHTAGSWSPGALPVLAEVLAELPELGSALRFESLRGEVEDLAKAWTAAPHPFPDLDGGDRLPYQQQTFILSDKQSETVKVALGRAKAMGAPEGSTNRNSNGNALARVCELWLASLPPQP